MAKLNRKTIMKKIDKWGHYITPNDPNSESTQKLISMIVSDNLIAQRTVAGNLIFKKTITKESL